MGRSLKRFDGKVFSDDEVRELLRGTTTYNDDGVEQVTLRDVFGPFWRFLCQRIDTLEKELALKTEMAANAAKATSRNKELEAQLSALKAQIEAEARQRLAASEAVMGSLQPWLDKPGRSRMLVSKSKGMLDQLKQFKSTHQQELHNQLPLPSGESPVPLELEAISPRVGLETNIAQNVAVLEADLRRKEEAVAEAMLRAHADVKKRLEACEA